MNTETAIADAWSEKISFDKVPYFSDRDIAYVTEDPRLEPFIKYPVTMDTFAKVFRDKKHDDTDRALLVSVLRKQYEKLGALTPDRETKIIKLLDKDTFTIISAHQPCLFTGPLYVIYKIIAVINAAKSINEAYPDKKVVPIYISGGEDHDFEEINHTYIFNNKLEWHDESASGPVGRLSTESMDKVLNELKEICGEDERAHKWFNLMNETYRKAENYGQATRQIIHELFKDTELLVVGMDDLEFKKSFSTIASREILKQFSAAYVRETQSELEKAGFQEQAYVRDINFFYLCDEGRKRIVYDDNIYHILDTDISFDSSAMAEEIQKHPERFSPNVVMRPIYQEFIFPNIAYIGGGGELAYWMERKTQFEAFGINFPMLIRRSSLLLVDKRSQKDLKKLNLTVEDLLKDIEDLIKKYTREQGDGETSLSAYRKQVHKLFLEIGLQAASIDKSLKSYVSAEERNVQKTLGQIESKLMKAEKDRLSIDLQKIRKLKDRLFPENSLQERRDNFLSWLIRYDQEFWEKLYAEIDVFDKRFHLVYF